jgi:hypothetical protein
VGREPSPIMLTARKTMHYAMESCVSAFKMNHKA